MSELLLEILSEEIPYAMQLPAANGYKNIFQVFLQSKNINYDQLNVYVGPRRITVHATGLPQTIQVEYKCLKGPKVSAPKQAIDGFCQTCGVASQEQLSKRFINQVEYFFYQPPDSIQNTMTLLQQNIPELIAAYTWSKSMYWGDHAIKWVRPLKNIMCIFAGSVVHFQYGHIHSNNLTYGHRFSAPQPFDVTSFSQYQHVLHERFVVIDHNVRQNNIEQMIQKITDSMNLVINRDEALLEEVVGLVEWPQVMIGQIDPKFLVLPSEVLIEVMKKHQKYFSLYHQDGTFAPYFLFVANVVSTTEQEQIIKGNEMVLSARLADALYFYNQDLKASIDGKLGLNELSRVVFHSKLGSMKDKIGRLNLIIEKLTSKLNLRVDDPVGICDAIFSCKNDLVSALVGELPALQGIMASYYYCDFKHVSKNDNVALIIRDHYKPQDRADDCPKGDAAILALIDKMDTLYGLILAGERPSGSKDPYALRRQALGVIRIILDNNLKIDIWRLLGIVNWVYVTEPKTESMDDKTKTTYYDNVNLAQGQVFEFFRERLKHFWAGQFSHNIINAILENIMSPSENAVFTLKQQEERRHEERMNYLNNMRGNSASSKTRRDSTMDEMRMMRLDIVDLQAKLLALNDFFSQGDRADMMISYKRVSNIIASAKQEVKAADFDSSLLKEKAEKELHSSIQECSAKVNKALTAKNYTRALHMLANMEQPINNFFKVIMVNTPDTAIANNRLALLMRVKDMFTMVANFDQL